MARGRASVASSSGSAAAAALQAAALEPAAFSRLASGSVKSVSCASSAPGYAAVERRPQTARRASSSDAGRSTGSARLGGGYDGFYSARPTYGQHHYNSGEVVGKQLVCTDLLSDGGRINKMTGKRRHGIRDRGAPINDMSGFRDGSKPWVFGDLHEYDYAAGMGSWEGCPRLKGHPGDLDHLGYMPVLGSGKRNLPNHPAANNTAHETIFNKKLPDYRNHEPDWEPEWADRSAGKSAFDPRPQSGKLSKMTHHHRGQTDRVAFGHDTFVRADVHPDGVFSEGEAAAGWPTWREKPGFETTLKATGCIGSPDGYKRQGRIEKPNTVDGESVTSCTHAHRGRKQPEFSSTFHSVINTVCFNDRTSQLPKRRRSPSLQRDSTPKPVIMHKTEEFQRLHDGAAGRHSGHLGKDALKNASFVMTKEDDLSVASTEVSGRSRRSLMSSQSVPVLGVGTSPNPLSPTSNRLYGKHELRYLSPIRGSPRTPALH